MDNEADDGARGSAERMTVFRDVALGLTLNKPLGGRLQL
jgi:hypothetical protein